MELRDEKLDFWLKNCLNVLFIGAAGVGKTARVIQAFERNNIRYKYFSAATMDPFVDFVGVPKVVKDANGEYLEYVLPRDMRDDKIEAIFMDEFNRSHKKVRNGVMELIQFKSINGKKFPNLRVVWAAINPEESEEEYQVEPLDKAQRDRFHVQIHVPSKPSREWFSEKYPGLAKPAIDWWEKLPAEIQKEVSPRRLEYALQVHNLRGGDMRDVLPPGCNVSQLLTTINNGSAIDKLTEYFQTSNTDAARKYLAVENNFTAAQSHLVSDSTKWLLFFLPLLAPEKLSLLVSAEDIICTHVLNNADKFTIYRRVMQDILAANINKKLVRRIKRVLGDNTSISQQYGNMINAHPAAPYFSNNDLVSNWAAQLVALTAQPMDKTPQRMKIYAEIAQTIPAVLTAEQAVTTLEVLNLTAGRCWPETLKDIKTLPGVFNHCIDQLNKTTGLSWSEILNLHGVKFENLLRKMVEAKLDDLILCPISKKSISELVIERNEELFKEAE